mmetsp:Transcript_35293/g.89329  ORF Transcript_35293/g.89329 Transcript_35293/m.89329 type:complete len:237 (+) Transcript_35293:1029-1739(+)
MLVLRTCVEGSMGTAACRLSTMAAPVGDPPGQGPGWVLPLMGDAVGVCSGAMGTATCSGAAVMGVLLGVTRSPAGTMLSVRMELEGVHGTDTDTPDIPTAVSPVPLRSALPTSSSSTAPSLVCRLLMGALAAGGVHMSGIADAALDAAACCSTSTGADAAVMRDEDGEPELAAAAAAAADAAAEPGPVSPSACCMSSAHSISCSRRAWSRGSSRRMSTTIMRYAKWQSVAPTCLSL